MPLDSIWWEEELGKLQERLGYRFRFPDLLRSALTHASYAHEYGEQEWNERLEFLGDAVLELCVSDELFRQHQGWNEGQLTKKRAQIVCTASLARWSRAVGLNRLIRLGRGLRRQGGGENDSLLADAGEALIGAVYVDGGIEAARQVIDKLMELSREWGKPVALDAKSRLQELLARENGTTPQYEVISTVGPPHETIYSVAVRRENGTCLGRGEGPSRKTAEQAAALSALRMMEDPGRD